MRPILLLGLLWLLAAAGAQAGGIERFSGEFRVSSGAQTAGAYPGGLASPSGALHVPPDAVAVHFDVAWARDSPAAQRLLFRACDGWCDEASVVGEVAGEPPLSLDVDVPASRNLTWQALVASGATAGSRIEGAAAFRPAVAAAQAAPPPEGGSTRALVAVGAAGLAALAWRFRPRAALVALYHRITRARLLDHPVRARIHAEVGRRPGVHFRALRDALRVGQGALDHHLRLLVRAGLLVEHRSAHARCFALPGALDAATLALAARVRSDAARALLRALAQGEAESVRALSLRAGLHESTLDDHVARFVADGLVEKRREAGRAALRLTPRGHRLAVALAGSVPTSP